MGDRSAVVKGRTRKILRVGGEQKGREKKLLIVDNTGKGSKTYRKKSRLKSLDENAER